MEKQIKWDQFVSDGIFTATHIIETAFSNHYLRMHQEDPESWPMELSEDEWLTAFGDFLSGFDLMAALKEAKAAK